MINISRIEKKSYFFHANCKSHKGAKRSKLIFDNFIWHIFKKDIQDKNGSKE